MIDYAKLRADVEAAPGDRVLVGKAALRELIAAGEAARPPARPIAMGKSA